MLPPSASPALPVPSACMAQGPLCPLGHLLSGMPIFWCLPCGSSCLWAPSCCSLGSASAGEWGPPDLTSRVVRSWAHSPTCLVPSKKTVAPCAPMSAVLLAGGKHTLRYAGWPRWRPRAGGPQDFLKHFTQQPLPAPQTLGL